MSRRYDGAVRSEHGIERRQAYSRARERARSAVAALHHDEFDALARRLRSGHAPHSREYSAAQATAKREIAARHPEDFAVLLDRHLFDRHLFAERRASHR